MNVSMSMNLALCSRHLHPQDGKVSLTTPCSATKPYSSPVILDSWLVLMGPLFKTVYLQGIFVCVVQTIDTL